MAATTRCAGIGCHNEEPAVGRDQGWGQPTHRGWLELRVDGARQRFCSWSCLVSFANDRLQATAGD